MAADEGHRLSIGELAERTGVAAETLRAWERRYGLLQPERTAGGHRRYRDADVARVLQMLRLERGGIPAGPAAAQLLSGLSGARPEPSPSATVTRGLRRDLELAADQLDVASAFGTLTAAGTRMTTATLLDEAVVPVLRHLGERWHQDARHVAREHVTSTAIRSWGVARLRELTNALGTPVVVACPDGEFHDLGAVMAALTLAESGWRPVVLGASTPWASAATVIDELDPPLVLIGTVSRPAALRLLERWEPPAAATVVFGGPALVERDVEGLHRIHLYTGSYGGLPAAIDVALRTG